MDCSQNEALESESKKTILLKRSMIQCLRFLALGTSADNNYENACQIFSAYSFPYSNLSFITLICCYSKFTGAQYQGNMSNCFCENLV